MQKNDRIRVRWLTGLAVALLLTLVCAAALANVPIDALHFSDEHFRAYVLTLDDGDGELTFEEIRDIRTIDVTDADIAELDGIEYFTALEELFCGHNRLTVLNLFHNTALKHLDCQFNELIAMGVSDTALTELNCSNNFLGSLELSSNTALTVLDCSANRITGVDLSNNTALTELNCSFNEMMWLDVSSNSTGKDRLLL